MESSTDHTHTHTRARCTISTR